MTKPERIAYKRFLRLLRILVLQGTICMVMLMMSGCAKDAGLVFSYKSPHYEIESYKPIIQEEINKVEKCFKFVMKQLNQKEINKPFKVKIFYNQYAYDTHVGNKGVKTNTTLGCCYNRRSTPLICIPYRAFNVNTISHEITHAIVGGNNLKTPDVESLPCMIGDLAEEGLCDQ